MTEKKGIPGFAGDQTPPGLIGLHKERGKLYHGELEVTPPNRIQGNKSGRKLSKETVTYKLFEKFFLGYPEEALPYTFQDMPKGQAINLAMGLNRCHVQWAQENGIPEEMMTRSAKAIANVDLSLPWTVEVSFNFRRAKKGSGNAPDWMKELLKEDAPACTEFEQVIIHELPGKEAKAIEPETDPTEDILKKHGYY